MTTKVIRIMFYDQEQQAFVVDTMEVEEEENGDTKEDFSPESQNERRSFAFSTLL